MNSGVKRAVVVCVIISVIIGLSWYFGLHEYITLSSLHNNRFYLETAVATNYSRSVIIYLLIYIGIIALAMPGVPVLTMVGGFLFGSLLGGVYASIGATVGTSISFLVIRYLLSNFIRGKYAERLEKFNEKIRSHGVASYLLTMQLMGLIPYFVINALAGLADVSFTTFLWTTFVGSLPILFIYSFAGHQLCLVHSVNDVFSPTIIGLLLFLVVLALIPLFLRFSRRVTDLA
jgi:uncharacterized membrane protein YdjX (TVP38/TMEM64 family)